MNPKSTVTTNDEAADNAAVNSGAEAAELSQEQLDHAAGGISVDPDKQNIRYTTMLDN